MNNIAFGLALVSVFTIGLGIAYSLNQRSANTKPEVQGISETRSSSFSSSSSVSSPESVGDRDIPILD